jgi:hypothetical protein
LLATTTNSRPDNEESPLNNNAEALSNILWPLYAQDHKIKFYFTISLSAYHNFSLFAYSFDSLEGLVNARDVRGFGGRMAECKNMSINKISPIHCWQRNLLVRQWFSLFFFAAASASADTANAVVPNRF